MKEVILISVLDIVLCLFNMKLCAVINVIMTVFLFIACRNKKVFYNKQCFISFIVVPSLIFLSTFLSYKTGVIGVDRMRIVIMLIIILMANAMSITIINEIKAASSVIEIKP